MADAPKCAECGCLSKLTIGAKIYSHRPDLHGKWFWKCINCESWVGCHPGTQIPMGAPAGRATREARQDAYICFDALWKSKEMTRHQAYQWLAAELGVRLQDTHISMMTADKARAVVEACDRYRIFQKERTGNG